MDKYSTKYMENHCIDVFFAYGLYPIHVLTAGSIIPHALNDILRNRTLQEEVERNDGGADLSAVSVNNNYVQQLIKRHQTIVEEVRQKSQYIGSGVFFPIPSANQVSFRFRFYASQGFYSYDCIEVKEDGTAVYRLMAWPNQPQQPPFELPQFTPKEFKVSNNVPHLPEYLEM